MQNGCPVGLITGDIDLDQSIEDNAKLWVDGAGWTVTKDGVTFDVTNYLLEASSSSEYIAISTSELTADSVKIFFEFSSAMEGRVKYWPRLNPDYLLYTDSTSGYSNYTHEIESLTGGVDYYFVSQAHDGNDWFDVSIPHLATPSDTIPAIGDGPEQVDVGSAFTFTATGFDEYWWRVQGNEVTGENSGTYVRAWTKELLDRNVCVASKLAGEVYADVAEDRFACFPLFDVVENLSSRRDSLLNSPWKVGYGASATGAGQSGELYTVTNTNDSGEGSLREGLEQGGRWVVYDPSLDGEVIESRDLVVGANTTWDGRDALVRIVGDTSKTYNNLIRISDGNCILHRILYGPLENQSIHNNPNNTSDNTSFWTGIVILAGQNYWIDHCEASNFDDDALGCLGNNLTVTHYKITNSNKGMLLSHDRLSLQEAGLTGRVTVAFSNMAAKWRNFKNSGGYFAHGFNNYTHGCDEGTESRHGEAENRDGTDTHAVIVDSSVFDGLSDNLLRGWSSSAPAAVTQGYIFTDGNNIHTGGNTPSNANYVFNPGDSVPNDPNGDAVSRPTIPYDVSSLQIQASQVKDYCEINAGVDGSNITFPPFA